MTDLTPEQSAILALHDELRAVKAEIAAIRKAVADQRAQIACVASDKVVRLPIRGAVG